jgi:type IV secretory pathway VirB2 component (pilin)
MRWITARIKWIMVVAGALTCTMAYAAISPHAALLNTFGESLQGPVADIVVRNWGALITLIGAMLIYGAFNPANRRLVLIVAGISKVVFIFLVLVYGAQYLSRAGVAVAVDSVLICLFAIYLVSTRGGLSSV